MRFKDSIKFRISRLVSKTDAFRLQHRVYRVPGFLYRPNRLPHPLTPHRGLPSPPPFGSKGDGTHALAGEGAGGANSDEGTDTLVL
jgi:hypothetical protein